MLTNKFIHRKCFYLYKTQRRSFALSGTDSLLFAHKKDLDRLQKQMTRMKNPLSACKLSITPEMDFEPGIKYFDIQDAFLSIYASPISTDEPTTSSGIEDGWVQVKIPFHQSADLRNAYRLLTTDRIRHGKLLEILDYVSAFSAYRHNHIYPKSKIATMVTASVDTIALFKSIDLNKQLTIAAYPTFTGESSMEIRIDLYNGDTLPDQEFESDETFRGSAFFVYVMREAYNYNKKKKVLPLEFNIKDTEEKQKAILRYEIGKENKKQRTNSMMRSLYVSPPTTEESQLLHKQFITYKSRKKVLGVSPCNTDNLTSLKTTKDTRTEKMVLMHSQNMNVNGHVFGGYIMREAIELGYVCAYRHSCKDDPPIPVCVDSVNFHKPVIVGSVAKFVADVCLVYEKLIHVCVEVFNYVDDPDNPVLTTTINITYQTNKKTAEVYPNSYECGVKYLDGKRKLENLFSFF